LNRVLTENHGKRIAVIENEFGEIGIDQALVINADEEIFEMSNGCICCTVRGDLIRILGNLMRRRDRFDHILVETTGLADPSPVAQTFFVDDEMREQLRLDGIVTLVDAKHVLLHLDDSEECKAQIGFADVVVLNKTDLVSEEDVAAVEERIRAMNAMARVHRAVNAAVPVEAVLDVGGFDLDRALAQKPTFLEPELPFEWGAVFGLGAGGATLALGSGPDPTMSVALLPVAAADPIELSAAADAASRLFSEAATERAPGEPIEPGATHFRLRLDRRGAKTFPVRVPAAGHYALFTQHLPEEHGLAVKIGARGRCAPEIEKRYAADHEHDASVTSVGIHREGAVDPDRLNKWLGKLLREQGADIFRMKGILNIAGQEERFVFQGVHMLFDGRADRPWGAMPRVNDLVFIGRKLDREALDAGFRRCLR
jgi:G3E family GTPase